MSLRISYSFCHLVVLAYVGVLLGAFVVQFALGEYPCPLCMLQRMAMLLCAIGAASVITRARFGQLAFGDLATGLGMSIVAAVAGAVMSSRQILLHIKPGDPGYGSPMLGLHLYTWALITFVIMITAAGGVLILTSKTRPVDVPFGWPSKLTIGLLAGTVLANVVVVFAQEGFHWVLPDNPDRYQLLYDLGIRS